MAEKGRTLSPDSALPFRDYPRHPELDNLTDMPPDWLWPESRPLRCIYGIGGLVVGGTFFLFASMMAYGYFIQGSRPGPFTFAATGTAATITSAFVAIPYVLGSLVARAARRPWWIAGICVAVGLVSVAFRVYVYGIVGGGQAFLNMILHAFPYSALILCGWTASLWYSTYAKEAPLPSATLRAMVTAAAVLGAGGSVAGWLLRDSVLWFQIGVPAVLASLGLGLWAIWRALREE